MGVVQTEKRDNLDLLLTRKQKKLITWNYKSCEDDASCSCDSFQRSTTCVSYQIWPPIQVSIKFHQKTNGLHEYVYSSLLATLAALTDSTEGPEFFRFSNSNYSYKTPLSYHTKLYFKHYSRDHINRKPKPIRFVSISEMCTKFSEKMIPENESEGTRRNEIELTLLNTLAVSGANEDGLMVTEGSYISNEENI
ncbi:hypothetical protein V6N11_043084 [Hibiscus sabdariffa]|uniref:Phlebovirus glycoprotein G2 fusion domain-containing protein n=1 Tax=Hibiscus sabdariffa TaxID=183260 RepID=A0ABR2QYC3_9ROSI